MVNLTATTLSDTFAALADPTRRAILSGWTGCLAKLATVVSEGGRR